MFFGFHIGHGDEQIVLLGDHGDKIQIQGLGRRIDAQTGIGRPAEHGHGHVHMGEFLVGITVDRIRRKTQLPQPVVDR